MASTPNRRKISRRGIQIGAKYTAGIGFLMIPEDIDRETYIINCFRNGTISFITENAERFDNVKVAKGILNQLDFPKTYQSIGSQIFFNVLPIANLPVVIAVLTKSGEVNLMSEDSFDITKRTTEATVSIIGDAKHGNLNISVDSHLDDKGGELNINIDNKNKTAKLNLAVNGKINITSTDELIITSAKKLNFTVLDPEDSSKSTIITYTKETGFSYKDEFENEITIDKDNIKINAKTAINLGNGKEPLVLGNTLKDLLSQLCTAIGAITVNTYVGPSTTPVNAVQFQLLSQQLETILSKYSNTD